MKMSKRWVTFLIAVCLLSTVIGCSNVAEQNSNATGNNAGNSSGNNAGNNAGNNGGNNAGNTSDGEETEQSVEKVPLTIVTSDFSQVVPGGETMEDPTLSYLAEQTNTDLEVIFLPHGQYKDQLDIKLASGEIPDVIMAFGVDNDLYVNDQLLPLDDLIEQHGPNLKKVISQEAWDALSRDGNIYAIPEMQKGNALTARALFVRKDLLEKVGYSTPPKTPDEFMDMLRKLKAMDPNLMPYSGRENLTWMDGIIGMYGISVYGGKMQDGELVPHTITPEMKQAIGFMKQMYDEGLLDPEFLTNKRNTWEQKIQSGQVAVWTHAPELAWDWQKRLNESLPGTGAKVALIPTPKAPGVEQAGFGRLPYNRTYMVTKSAEHPEQAVKLLDWLASEEGQKFVNFGVPGITYTEENGNISYNKQKDIDDQTLNWRTLVFNIVGWNEEFAKLQLGEEAYKIMKQAQDGFDSQTTGLVIPKHPLPEVGEFGAPNSLFIETASKIILGEEPLDYFDEYVKQWRKLGGDELIKDATKAYNER